jgi:hypothetical protein
MAVPGAPGAPNIFKEDLGRNLNRVFPPPFGGFEIPKVLGGVVALTHDFPGTAPYLAVSLFDVVGAADVTSIATAVSPPDGFIWLVDDCSILAASEPASRVLRLFLGYVTSLGTITVTLARQTTDTIVGIPYTVGRRFVMPPQSVLNLSANVLTAGANLRMTFSYLQLPAGQFCPKS